MADQRGHRGVTCPAERDVPPVGWKDEAVAGGAAGGGHRVAPQTRRGTDLLTRFFSRSAAPELSAVSMTRPVAPETRTTPAARLTLRKALEASAVGWVLRNV